MKINYRFADGHYEEIEVSQEVAEAIVVLDRKEASYERKLRNHPTVLLSAIPYEGEWFADGRTPDYYYELDESQARVDEFLNILSDKQRERLVYKMENPEASFRDIAVFFHADVKSVFRSFSIIQRKAIAFFNL